MGGSMRWGMIAALVGTTGCGPSAEPPSCTDPPPLEVTYPPELSEDLVAAATEHALGRLEQFMSPLRGYAFEGSFEATSNGVVRAATDAIGLLSVEGPWLHLELSSPDPRAWLTLEYHAPTRPDRITPGDWGVVCPTDLPVPAPSQPFQLPSTTCVAMERGADTVLTVDLQPLDPDELDLQDLLLLNELQIHGRTPWSGGFEFEGPVGTTIDNASYRSGEGTVWLYVDYEAHWSIGRECPTSHAITSLDILHAEVCDISGHTHGRYDSSCTTVATIDGRPEWADGF